MATATASRAGSGRSREVPRAVIRPRGAAYWLSGGLALAAAVSSVPTFVAAGVLRGTAVMNGSARGTALVVLLIGVPACSARCCWRRADQPARC